MKIESGNIIGGGAMKDFVQSFIANMGVEDMRTEENDKRSLVFIRDFAEWLFYVKKFTIKGSFNTKTQTLVFSGKSTGNFPVIFIRHESGLPPAAFWIRKNGSRANLSFNAEQVRCAKDWYERTFQLLENK